jgi:hypothetical protein
MTTPSFGFGTADNPIRTTLRNNIGLLSLLSLLLSFFALLAM